MTEKRQDSSNHLSKVVCQRFGCEGQSYKPRSHRDPTSCFDQIGDHCLHHRSSTIRQSWMPCNNRSCTEVISHNIHIRVWQ